MKYFTLGPVEMDAETLKISQNPLPYFRDESFSDINLTLVRRLKDFLKTAASTRIAMLTASGTAAMEAAVSQVFTTQDRLLIINGGGFGQRFVEICRWHSIPYEELKLAPDEPLTTQVLSAYQNKQVSGILVNVHETSNGRLYPLKALSTFAKKKQATLVVDAISSFMADPFEMDDQGVDIAIFSSHKSLSVAPGLAFVAINETTWKNRINKVAPLSFYMDLSSHVQQIERGQTPFTPAVGVIIQLSDKLRRIEQMGLDSFLANIESRASHFREMISNTPFLVPEYPLSNALTPILIPDDKAEHFYNRLRSDYGILVNPCSGRWANTMLRVGHMGCLTLEDNNKLVCALNNIAAAS